MKVLKWLDDHFEEFFLVILLVLISCVSLAQVTFKKLPFLTALTWSEEFSKFMWIWTVFLSLPYTIRKGSMLRVSVLLDTMPQVARKVINLLVDLIVMFCMGLLAYCSYGVIFGTSGIMASGEASTAMQWPMWIVYCVMLAGYALAALRAFQQAVIHIMHFGEKELTTLEQTMQDAAEEASMAKNAEGGKH